MVQLSTTVLLFALSSVQSARLDVDMKNLMQELGDDGLALQEEEPVEEMPQDWPASFNGSMALAQIGAGEFPQDSNKGTELLWKDMKVLRDTDNEDFMYPCTMQGGAASVLGHEFFVFGHAGLRYINDEPADHTNCNGPIAAIVPNPWYSPAIGYRTGRATGLSGSSADTSSRQVGAVVNSTGTVFCYDHANSDSMKVKCWRWSIKYQCYRHVADELATYFNQYRSYSFTRGLFGGLGKDYNRLSQDCSKAPWNDIKKDGHYWMNYEKGRGAVCWTFTWYFKALYCQYKREKKHHCGDYE